MVWPCALLALSRNNSWLEALWKPKTRIFASHFGYHERTVDTYGFWFAVGGHTAGLHLRIAMGLRRLAAVYCRCGHLRDVEADAHGFSCRHCHWRSVLSEFEDDKRFFRVMLPSNSSLSKGKKMVLTSCLRSTQLGKNLIACVDSDYDYLLQDATDVSREMNTNPYIFQTYAYAIENYQCYAENLHDICVESTLNDHQVFDFSAYMHEYSEIVYPLFVWNIMLYRAHMNNSFPMNVFCNVTIPPTIESASLNLVWMDCAYKWKRNSGNWKADCRSSWISSMLWIRSCNNLVSRRKPLTSL